MASDSLNLYLVVSRDPDTKEDMAEVVIAENTQQAADVVAFCRDRTYRSVDENNVGRLGEYEPGFVGHSLVIDVITRGSKNGAIILSQPLRKAE